MSVTASAVVMFILTGSSSAAVRCSLVASPSGSDGAAGTVTAPLRTAQKLTDSLAPGQTGCLRAGTYYENLRITSPGITLRSYPGETATVVGRMYLVAGANGVTITHLDLNGENSGVLPSPSVNANNATFSYDDVTNDHTAICFDLGSIDYGTAANTVITDSRIHDCGVLPPNNHEHGIYVQDASGTVIEWNLIYANADRGVQLYPNAQYTTVAHNIINGNGTGVEFSGDDGVASNNAHVYDNVLSNATVNYDAESWYPSGNPVGSGNTLVNNCLWGGAAGMVETYFGGFTASENTVANPEFANPSAGNFSMGASSPCRALVGDVESAVDGSKAYTATKHRTLKARSARSKRHHHRRRHRHHRRRHARFLNASFRSL